MIADRYFVVPENQVSSVLSRAILIPDNDVLPLTDLSNTHIVATVKDGRKVVHARLSHGDVEDISTLAESADPLSRATVVLMDIESSYAGMSREEVITKFPELSGQVKVGTDEEGNDILKDKLERHEWL
jgi:hypothetical protein